MDTKYWKVTVGLPTTDVNNKVNVTVDYLYDDGTIKQEFKDNYSGVLGNDNLIRLIQENLQAHDQTVQGLLNAPSIVSGEIDLSQLFPQPVPPAVLLKKTDQVTLER